MMVCSHSFVAREAGNSYHWGFTLKAQTRAALGQLRAAHSLPCASLVRNKRQPPSLRRSKSNRLNSPPHALGEPDRRHSRGSAASWLANRTEAGAVSERSAPISYFEELRDGDEGQHHSQALQLAGEGDHAGAFEYLCRLMKRYPKNVKVVTSAALEAGHLGRPEVARKLWEKAHAMELDNPVVLRAWASMEGAHGRVQSARQLFRRAIDACGAGIGPESQAVELESPAKFQVPSPAPESHAERVESMLAWAHFEIGCLDSARDSESQKDALERARGLFAAVLQLEPSHAPAAYGLGSLAEKAGDWRAARELYKRAADMDPAFPRAYEGWALMEAKLGSMPNARTVFQRGLDLAQPSADLLCSWGRAEAKRHKFKDARELFNKALELDPFHAKGLLLLGQLEARFGNGKEARELYARGLEREPKNVRLLTSAAQMHSKMGESEEAKALLERVVQVEPNNGHVGNMLGLNAQAAGEFDAARQHFLRGVQCSDKRGSLLCYESLAKLESFCGDEEAARRAFSDGMGRWRPPNARFLREWALFEKRQNDLELAGKLFAKATALDPTDDKTWLQWALLLRRQKDWDGARRAFQRAIELTPRNPYPYQMWALMERLVGETERARLIFEDAHLACGNNGPLLMEWALLEASSGQTDVARELFRRGSRLREVHLPLLEAWACFEEQQGGDKEMAQKLRERLAKMSEKLAAKAPTKAPPPDRKKRRAKKTIPGPHGKKP